MVIYLLNVRIPTFPPVSDAAHENQEGARHTISEKLRQTEMNLTAADIASRRSSVQSFRLSQLYQAENETTGFIVFVFVLLSQEGYVSSSTHIHLSSGIYQEQNGILAVQGTTLGPQPRTAPQEYLSANLRPDASWATAEEDWGRCTF
ncbi:hypothetical protein AcW1_001824 [Taiwanofungus camphoratus]|nr:hypothetical protein AcV7_001678 [Antrodia cinnamomea]KAI0945655.1 hypothetical protein AcW1_001824 [Antrodia cinnamomea]